MIHLPAELVSYILELATCNDRDTARQLCLVSRPVQSIALPLLYKHVCLSGTEQIQSFNATMSSSPELGRLVHGMTLLDDTLALLPLDYIGAALNNEAQSPVNWVKHWKDLIHHLGNLSRQYSLKTLILSYEACIRLQYTGEELRGNCPNVLSDKLEQSELRLDHLVISHASVNYFLAKVKTTKLTWYGCNFPAQRKALNLYECWPVKFYDQ